MLNASSPTMSNALQQEKNERIRVIRVLQVLLTSCLQGCKRTAFNLFSNVSFPHTPYSFPLSLSCLLLSRNYVRTSADFSLELVGISPTYQDIGLYKVGLRVKASESSPRCEGGAVNSARKKRLARSVFPKQPRSQRLP